MEQASGLYSEAKLHFTLAVSSGPQQVWIIAETALYLASQGGLQTLIRTLPLSLHLPSSQTKIHSLGLKKELKNDTSINNARVWHLVSSDAFLQLKQKHKQPAGWGKQEGLCGCGWGGMNGGCFTIQSKGW